MLNLKETERAIQQIKDFFQMNLAAELGLRRVTAPLFVKRGTGINDDLNGIERPVAFPIKDMDETVAEVVHSLAKWKRLMLGSLDIEKGYGLYTDMNAIRPDEDLGNLHSLYVDQWDWERVVDVKERNLEFLKYIVRKIYGVMKRTETMVYENYEQLKPFLPEEIHFVHTEELQQEYPELTPKEREDKVVKEHGAVFVIGIGSRLADGEKHDGRAPDYDDWSSETENGFKGLNGDILVWNPVLKRAYELSSMGIRVDKEALLRQLDSEGENARTSLYFHQQLLSDALPLSIGGGIGQSRLCMFYLKKAHIGEIQSSIWPDAMIEECKAANIPLI